MSHVFSGVLYAALLLATWIDTRRRIIPNRLTYPLVVMGLSINGTAGLLSCESGLGLVGPLSAVHGALLCFGVMLMLFLMNATGGGDVKLATALGAFMGADDGLMAIAWCHLLAGIFAGLWVLSRIDLRASLKWLIYVIQHVLITRQVPMVGLTSSQIAGQRIPMAAFFTLGVLVTQLGGRLW